MSNGYVNRTHTKKRGVKRTKTARRLDSRPRKQAPNNAGLPLVSTNIKQAPVKGYPFYMKIAAFVIVISLLLLALTTCSHDEGVDTSIIFNERLRSAYTEIDFAYTLKDTVPQKEKLIELAGEENAASILKAAQTDKDALWLASHPEGLAKDGAEVQSKLFDLAVADPASYAYIRDFAENYPVDNKIDDASIGMSTASPSSDVPDTDFPHFYQWDRRWGNSVYCSTSFGLTGCGPTALAMIYQGLTGKTDLDPYDMGIKAQEYGYMDQYNGTGHGFFSHVANDLGIHCEMESPSAELITSSLAAGKPIIINFGPGYFTHFGHFAVLTGLDDDGKVIMNDPYSVVRSSQTWDAELLASEAPVMYVYSN